MNYTPGDIAKYKAKCEGLDVFITFTLDPKTYTKIAHKQLQCSIRFLENILDIFSSDYVAVAELTKHTNIHYHVLLNWNRTMMYPKDRLTDLLKIVKTLGSNVDIQDVKDHNHCIEYIFKDLLRTDSVVNNGKRKTIIPIIYFKHKKPLETCIKYNLDL